MHRSCAVHPNKSRGRLFQEDGIDHRSLYQRDRDRIIHSVAFRRLKHKTQVFVAHEGDHFRTRLTHSIEVGQIARTISAALGLNVDLTEAISLAHDLGHTPFGHTGEETLNSCMLSYGGFDHNAHAIKIVTKLEKSYARFDGLNLTWETLEGIVKHNGPLELPLNYYLSRYNNAHDLETQRFASCEAQVAAVSDDIAYNNHDLSDGLRAGLFELDDLSNVRCNYKFLLLIIGVTHTTLLIMALVRFQSLNVGLLVPIFFSRTQTVNLAWGLMRLRRIELAATWTILAVNGGIQPTLIRLKRIDFRRRLSISRN